MRFLRNLFGQGRGTGTDTDPPKPKGGSAPHPALLEARRLYNETEDRLKEEADLWAAQNFDKVIDRLIEAGRNHESRFDYPEPDKDFGHRPRATRYQAEALRNRLKEYGMSVYVHSYADDYYCTIYIK